MGSIVQIMGKLSIVKGLKIIIHMVEVINVMIFYSEYLILHIILKYIKYSYLAQ